MFEGICLSSKCVHTQVWLRPLTDGYAVILFNRAHIFDMNAKSFTNEDVVINWQDLGLPVSFLLFLEAVIIIDKDLMTVRRDP